MRQRNLIVGLTAALMASVASAEVEKANRANLAGTDHLGRRLVSYEEAGPEKKGKEIGLFYYLWHGAHGTEGPYDITKIEAADPEALSHPDSPLWPNPSFPPMFHWGEPLWGYYLSTDDWVLRRQIEMFIQAGVDVLYFDTTNGYHYRDCTDHLFPLLEEYRERGYASPKFCYYMAPEPNVLGAPNVLNVWDAYYKERKFEKSYYRWQGKPLMIAHPDRPYKDELRDFFTWRKATWSNGGCTNTWCWWGIHKPVANVDEHGRKEMIAITVGSPSFPADVESAWPQYDGKFMHHGCSEAHFGRPTEGRSWHHGHKDTRPNASEYGFYFQEQIDEALDPKNADVPVAFVCQWNEWLVPFRTKKMTGWGHIKHWLLLMDEYNMEYSRDIEPMKGGYKDAYYFQMMNFIRRWKGLPAPAKAKGVYALAEDDLDGWASVSPVYEEMTGDCAPRNHRGYDKAGVYTNATGRNEFKYLKVAVLKDAVAFYAETVKPLTPETDPHWMELFVKVPGAKTDAMGFTHRVCKRTEGVICAHNGNKLVYTVPAKLLGVDVTKPFRLEFKWSDNRQADDVMDFYVNGDAAPRGRLNWLFIWEP